MIGKQRARISVLSREPSLLKYNLNSLQFFGLRCAFPKVLGKVVQSGQGMNLVWNKGFRSHKTFDYHNQIGHAHMVVSGWFHHKRWLELSI